jgi:uncharacterized protein (DUF983 family)
MFIESWLIMFPYGLLLTAAWATFSIIATEEDDGPPQFCIFVGAIYTLFMTVQTARVEKHGNTLNNWQVYPGVLLLTLIIALLLYRGTKNGRINWNYVAYGIPVALSGMLFFL